MASPLDFFEAGRKGGKSTQSPFVGATENVMSAFDKQAEAGYKTKQLMGLEKYKSELKANAPISAKDQAAIGASNATAAYKNQQAEDLKNNPGGRRRTLSPEEMVARKAAVGMPPDQAGRLESSLEGVRALRHMRALLFPDGTTESFQRQAAYKKSPFPFSKPVPNDYTARSLYRRAGQAIAGKLLVQSGVSTRPDEYERLGEQLVANAFSNPQEAWDAINEGEGFYSGFISDVDPSKAFHKPEELDYNYTNQYGNQLQDSGRADTAPDASTTSQSDQTSLLPVEQARQLIRAKVAKDPTKAELYAKRFEQNYPGEKL